MNSLASGLQRLANAFRIEYLLGESDSRHRNLHPHRLRKTVGRIVGLALTNSVRLLMEVYGHEDPEMTVAYLLSNEDIAQEAQDVARAQTIMFAATAVENIENYVGGAAPQITESVKSFAKLRGVSALDAKNIQELAADLTEDGRYWELVRPGVLCTKKPGQIGRCNGQLGAPDSSNCSVRCDHRLERNAEEESAKRTLDSLLDHYEESIDSAELLLAEHYKGQIEALLPRFAGAHPSLRNSERLKRTMGLDHD